jgi:hypothetical protein
MQLRNLSETETTMNHVPPAPACSLSQADLARRSARWRELANSALQQASATPRGQRLTFSASQEAADELEELAALERRCCPFATWSVDSADGQLTLDISATSQEGVEAVHALFSDLPGAAPA